MRSSALAERSIMAFLFYVERNFSSLKKSTIKNYKVTQL